ncbi:hypothetical protein M501DRAFT_974919 [Patellaria atrata CBS 101060]|uniref:Conserved oligomeric Golgi complex subunit 5 n=1 Tax=Patellaria atrata CBS 101060 TaxID=1346257 RepID=A0A9P4VMC9_9PEZI|nr:hypothetical protein M501DRAFT_974919 [Patellaria atrata CBS 101060]
MAEEETSYIDYEAFLDPSFSAVEFANALLLSTNNPSDTPLDLSTPLSKVLFDVQEIDTHIDTLTTKSALPLLDYTKDNARASSRILQEVESQVASLTEGYRALEKDVIERYEAAEQVRLAAERLCQTVKIGRAVGRCLMLGRQLEIQVNELSSSSGSNASKREDHRAMIRASNTILSLGQILTASGPGEEGEGLDRINAIITLKNELINPSERNIISRSQQIIREFSMSSIAASNTASTSAPTYAQTEETRSRTTSAISTLYLLSPTRRSTSSSNFSPKLLIIALQDYLQTALKSSLASLVRGLSTLPTLDRTLLEISARCQNIVALETLLDSTKPPIHPLLNTLEPVSLDSSSGETTLNFLQVLLQSLDTSSLPSYFWRSLASSLSPRVQEIMTRGGVSARTLKSNKERVRDALRECVNRGSQLPVSPFNRGKGIMAGNWEREAAVMVGSVLGVLGR